MLQKYRMTILSHISCPLLKADLHGKRKSLVSFMMLSKILIIQQRPCSEELKTLYVNFLQVKMKRGKKSLT